jgi:hypothetical protein
MARRIDKLQINALNASNNNILVARGGELAFDDPGNVFVGGATDAGFANVSLEANLANVALEANVANTVLSISNFTTDDLNEGSANLYFTDSRAITAVDPKLTTANVTELDNLYFTNARVLAALEGQDINLNDVTIYGDLTVQGNTTTLNTSTLVVEDKTILISSGASDSSAADNSGIVIDGAQANIIYQNTGDRFSINKNIQVTGNVSASDSVVANSFVSSGFGVPTIESATNIVLSANGTNGGAVVIQDSALRLRSYDDGAIANLTASAGDAIFNSSIGKAQIYDGANWANVGAGIADGDQDYSGNLLPTASNTYSLGSSDLRWKDLYLSGNTIFLGDVQLSSSNSKLVVNSIEANIIVTSNPTLYSAGRGITISQAGIIATSADDSEVYDIGIDESIGYEITNALQTALSFSNVTNFPALLYGFTITNASAATVNLDGQYRTNDGNVYPFANSLPISSANTLEFIGIKPEVLLPGTSILLRASANSSLYATFVYKTQDEASFTKFISNISTSGQFVDVFSTESSALVESVKVFNRTNSALPVTSIWSDLSNGIKSYLAANAVVSTKGFRELLGGPKLMKSGDKIRLANFGGSSNACTVMVSARYGEIYNVVQSSNIISEGETVTYSITTLNVPSFSTRYFRTVSATGNVNTSDFIGGNTGSFVIIDGAANITLTANSDLNADFEGDETFNLVIARDSVVGATLKTVDQTTLIRDTSNLINFSSASAPSSMFETEEAIITINMINALGSPGGTVYYTITGNADIYSNTSGAIEINNNTANLSIIAEASVPDNEERQFAVQIRRDSISGTIIGTTSNIIVKPIPGGPVGISATGGDEVIEIET